MKEHVSTAALPAQSSANEESHLERLLVIEPGIDGRLVGSLQILGSEAGGSADTLRYVFTGELEVYTPENTSEALMNIESLLAPGPLEDLAR